MTKLHLFLAQAAPGPAAPGGSMLSLLFPVLMVGAMYFLLIAPQNKKRKDLEKMIAELKSGDEVLTAGGMFGVITSVKDDRFVIRVGDNNAKVEIKKGFVSELVKKADAA